MNRLRNLSGTLVPAFLFLVACLSAPTLSAQINVYSSPIQFDRPDFDSVTLVEFPFSLSRDQFEFYQPDSGRGLYVARIFAQLKLFGTDGMPIDSANTYFSAAAATLEDAAQPGISLFNSLALVMQPGVYSARLSVIDVVSKAEGEKFFERLVISPPVRDRLAIGGECLAHSVAYLGAGASAVGVELRNGYEVLTNPNGVFSIKDTAISLYAEVYNLDYDPQQESEFVVTLSVQKPIEGATDLGTRRLVKPGATAVVVDRIDITGWPAGNYELRLTVDDYEGYAQASVELPFRLAVPVDPESAPMIRQFADSVGLPALEEQMRLVYYDLLPEEKAALRSLSDEGKLSFLAQFWRDRDPDPTTPVNEQLMTMLGRYRFANQHFSFEEGGQDGWFSDRGRIYMQHGSWDVLKDEFHPSDQRPYQVWYYYQMKEGTVFLFVDEDGFGDFRLRHSNLEGEVFSSYWDQILRTGVLELE